MFELLFLLLGVARAALTIRGGLVAENLLLRHQLAVLTRPARTGSVEMGGFQARHCPYRHSSVSPLTSTTGPGTSPIGNWMALAIGPTT